MTQSSGLPTRCTPRLAAGAAVLCILITGCQRGKVAADSTPTATPPVVAAAKAEISDLRRSIILTAEFRPFQEVNVMAKVTGYIKKLHVDVGDRIQPGQMIAELEIPEMLDDQARADAAIKRTQAEVERSRDELRRTESAHEIAHISYKRLADVLKARPGLVAQQEVDNAQNRDHVAEAQIASSKSALAVAEEQVRVSQAERVKLNTLYAYSKVLAPFAGVVTKRYSDTGAMILAGSASATPVVQLCQNNVLRLIFPVPESAVSRIRLGTTVQVRVPTLDRSFPGRVARYADKVDRATRTMDTEVDVPNPNLVLIPGMYAEVSLGVDERKGVVVVPLQSLGGSEDAPNVMVVKGDGRLELRTVETGLQDSSRSEIVSGLEAGEVVVNGSRGRLNAGQTVQPKIISLEGDVK
ncbi:MAG: efflux RND transporter periplasmic adaptor subunit [Acidobacteria bacterium]|nr:efflux RND transporter periplasmic adaptor subunit [Acidobacteriota bacterium]